MSCVAAVWKRVGEDIQKKFQRAAERVAEIHRCAFVGYRYQPKRGTQLKQLPLAPSTEPQSAPIPDFSSFLSPAIAGSSRHVKSTTTAHRNSGAPHKSRRARPRIAQYSSHGMPKIFQLQCLLDEKLYEGLKYKQPSRLQHQPRLQLNEQQPPLVHYAESTNTSPTCRVSPLRTGHFTSFASL